MLQLNNNSLLCHSRDEPVLSLDIRSLKLEDLEPDIISERSFLEKTLTKEKYVHIQLSWQIHGFHHYNEHVIGLTMSDFTVFHLHYSITMLLCFENWLVISIFFFYALCEKASHLPA